MDKKHCKFKDKVSEKIYAALESMYQVIEGKDIPEELKKKLKINVPKDEDIRLKVSIYYLRWCKFINNVIENDNINCDNIEYYLQSNSLVEMKHLGLGYYFDVKYPKQTATLYSVGYGKESDWKKWLDGQNIKTNHIKENGMQLIFKACKEHINTGGDCRLKSMSKCFGVDLFKYMRLDENNNANIFIIKEALVNFIQINQEIFSIQDYLVSDKIFDESVQFCIDFTNVRDDKAENYNSWSKRFLGENEFISMKELSDKKEEFGIKDERYDSFIFYLLQSKRKESGEKAISSRVSPIVDREVIVSDTLWKIQDGIDNDKMKEEQCYHFTFTEVEYIQLIYYYFMKYAEKKGGKEYNSKSLLEKIETEITGIHILITSKENVSEEVSEETLKEINALKTIKNICEKVKEKITIITLSDNIPQNIEIVLNTINWENENIPETWSLGNIYHAKNKKEENLICNIIKCLCKDLVMKRGGL